jgi:chorismate dehydratase
MPRLGVVSFLNSKPLIAGLDLRPEVQLTFDVPAKLPELLISGGVDAALVPIVDVLRAPQPWSIVSDACIGCDGETMTVRVFSQVPPDRITHLHVDGDSHTSVALARILWRELYSQTLELHPWQAAADESQAMPEAVLLIGDKVVDPTRAGYAYEVDLGGAWRQMTGLPFVFAVWASPEPQLELAKILQTARDRGLEQLDSIAQLYAPRHGWSVAQATRYLVRCLKFTLDQRMVAGAERFAELVRRENLAPGDAGLHWPEHLHPTLRATQ